MQADSIEGAGPAPWAKRWNLANWRLLSAFLRGDRWAESCWLSTQRGSRCSKDGEDWPFSGTSGFTPIIGARRPAMLFSGPRRLGHVPSDAVFSRRSHSLGARERGREVEGAQRVHRLGARFRQVHACARTFCAADSPLSAWAATGTQALRRIVATTTAVAPCVEKTLATCINAIDITPDYYAVSTTL